MAQLDRVLPRLDSRAVTEVVLEIDTPIRCVSRAGVQPVTQQALTRQQLLALVAEVAAPAERLGIMAGDEIDVHYALNGRSYTLQRDPDAPTLRVRIRRIEDVRSVWVETGVPAGAPRPAAVAVVPAPATQSSDADADASDSPDQTSEDAPMAADDAWTPAAAVVALAAPEEQPAGDDEKTAAMVDAAGEAVTPTGFEVPRVNWRLRAGDRALGPFSTEPDAKAEMERLLRAQSELGAADLHLRIGEPPIVRIGGDLQRMEGEPAFDEARLLAMLLAIMPDKNRDEFDASWDTDFAHEIKGLSRFRVNAFKDRNGVAAVLRTIASETVTVEQMGITAEVQQLCHLTKGLVLVTGPTGSGKSTTLCALIDLVNRSRKDHIITIEDPIEFVHESKQCLITQRQVGVHTQSFKSALRAALREDPDIIMVGELRDLETIAIALETAETGHLVFGTLHTSTAASTINRIVDQFPADRQDQIKVMLAESLKGVISQTLCKKVGGGRVAAREILLVTKAVSAMIRENKSVQINNIIQTQKKLGMETLNDALLHLVKSKTVEPQEAYVKSVEKKDMALKLRALGHDMSAYTSDE